jgi:type IV pilus assembly protein PilW
MNATVFRHISRSSGFTLVELMIALVLGLVVLGGVLTVYMNHSSTARFQSGVMRVQENGRFAVDLLSRSLRMAGYDDPDVGNSVPNSFIGGTTGSTGTSFTETRLDDDGEPLFVLKADGDTVSAIYEGGTEIRDCQGISMDTSPPPITTNQYAIATDADDVSHLICYTADNNGQPLAEGVEDMRVLYGLDLGGDGVTERYVSADNVGNWSQVVSVQVALLVNSVVPALSQDDTVCLGCTVFAGSNDRLVRAEFQAIIEIRNNLEDP